MKIGMIGLQSRHLDFFTEQINIEKRFPGVTVTGVWGNDEPERLPDIAEKLLIPNVCNTIEELFDICDTVFVLPRNGYTHMKYARAALERGKAVFVDKPFAIGEKEALELVQIADQKGGALAGGSTLCYLPEVISIASNEKKSPVTMISYSADPDSIYGGWAYYGSHLCDICACVCGTEGRSVYAKRNGKSVSVIVSYDNYQAILHSDMGRKCPEIIVANERYLPVALNDSICFRYGLENFIRELQSGSRVSYERLIFSSKLLEACIRSMNEGRSIDLT